MGTCMVVLFLSYGEVIPDVGGEIGTGTCGEFVLFICCSSHLFQYHHSPLANTFVSFASKPVRKAKLLAVASADLLHVSEYHPRHWALGSFK